jgi:chromosome segregation ATPase
MSAACIFSCDFYQGMKLLRVIVEEKMQENMQAALIKLKADTRVAIKRTIEQKRVDTTTDKPGIFSEIKNAMFNPVPYDVSQSEDKIKKDIDKQSAINKATDDENNAKENLVNINKEIKDISDEIVSLTQMVDVITKKKHQADAELAAAPAPTSSTLLTKVAEVQTELNEATDKLKEFGIKKEELKTNITAAEKTLNDYTEVKNKLLTNP